MTGGTDENVMLWAACELHIRPWHYARLAAGEKVLIRLMYDARKKPLEDT